MFSQLCKEIMILNRKCPYFVDLVLLFCILHLWCPIIVTIKIRFFSSKRCKKIRRLCFSAFLLMGKSQNRTTVYSLYLKLKNIMLWAVSYDWKQKVVETFVLWFAAEILFPVCSFGKQDGNCNSSLASPVSSGHFIASYI